MKRVVRWESEALALAQEIVRLPSVSGDEEAVAAAVEAEMRLLGYDAVRRDDLGSVVGVVRGAHPGDTVLIDGHMDTVPPGEVASWTHAPHSGDIEGGRLWGRGAVDVKGSLAAAIVAVGSLDRERLAGVVVVSASVGEEMLEGVALGRVVDVHPADSVVICEPTGLRLGIGHKGRTALVLTAHGRPAHSAHPERGDNAVYRMIDAVARVRALPAHRDEILGAGVMELVEMVSEPLPGTSIVPWGCRARFDRRLVRGETAASVLAEVRGALAPLGPRVDVALHRAPLACYTGASFEVEDFRPAWALDEGSDTVRQARAALREAGLPDATWLAPYSTNGAASAGERGIPTIIYGAGEITRAHVADESVEIDALEAAFRGYRALALALAAPGDPA